MSIENANVDKNTVFIALPRSDYYDKILEALVTVTAKMDEIIKGQADIRENIKEVMSKVSSTQTLPVMNIQGTIAATAKEIHNLEMEIVPQAVEQPKIVEATEVLKKVPAKVPMETKYQKARQFILDYLANGERQISDMNAAAREAKLSKDSYDNAKHDLCAEGKIERRRSGGQVNTRFAVRLAGTAPTLASDEPIKHENGPTIEEVLAENPTDFESYDMKVGRLASAIIKKSPKGKYKTIASVFKEIFDTMTAQYGICWAQLGKELKRSQNLTRVPSRMVVCYSDETARSIFMAKIEDMYVNLAKETSKADKAGEQTKSTGKVVANTTQMPFKKTRGCVQDAVRDFIQTTHSQNNYAAVFNEICGRMSRQGVDWDLEQKKYRNNTGAHKKVVRKSCLIDNDQTLYCRFCAVLDEMTAA